MRWSFLLLLSIGCGRAPAPVQPACASCPRCPSLASTVSTPEQTTTAIAPEERTRVLASLFPKRLEALRDCPKPTRQPSTWVEVDDLWSENLDAGHFAPIIERRERGRFSSADAADEVRFIIRIDNCQQSSGTLRIEAVFSEWSLAGGSPAQWRRPRPILLREHVTP